MSQIPLSPDHSVAELVLGDMTLVYALIPETGRVTFTCLPSATLAQRSPKRQILETPEIVNLPANWLPAAATVPESLVQLQVRDYGPPAAFAQGRTLRNGETCARLRYTAQSIRENAGETTITTTVACPEFSVDHVAQYFSGDEGFRAWTVFHNLSAQTLTLDMIASFSLSGITPFDAADAPERLVAHRIRSAWSAEGRLESRLLEELNLERSWIGYAHFSERFGQVGSMPAKGFFPFVALEDTVAKVCWGAQLELASSWQMEIYRKHDDACLSGGLADREFGHWWKTVQPGQKFTTPRAALSTACGDLEDVCCRLTSLQNRAADRQPAGERTLPTVYNEWCASWGNPGHDSLVTTARKLAGTGIRYLVIDDGWAERPGEGHQQNGDWKVNKAAFSGGLKAACDAIRAEGLVPGIWFEFEVCNAGSDAWMQSDHHLRRDGKVLQVGNRRFWDFRDPFTFDYLRRKVIHLLRDSGFGYLKVDYNETIGFGVDGAESPGEGLRQHIAAVQDFFREIRRELPDLVIENCSSGGHRLEPSMQALCAMGSFSDAHETVEIPIIAARLHRVVLPRQCQVWAVLRTTDSDRRLYYSLAATFLGRMAISGDITGLNTEQMGILGEATAFYRAAVPLILQGRTRFQGQNGPSWRHPIGWQAVNRLSRDGTGLLVVCHRFANSSDTTLRIVLPGEGWRIARHFNPSSHACIRPDGLDLGPMPEFSACAFILER